MSNSWHKGCFIRKYRHPALSFPPPTPRPNSTTPAFANSPLAPPLAPGASPARGFSSFRAVCGVPRATQRAGCRCGVQLRQQLADDGSGPGMYVSYTSDHGMLAHSSGWHAGCFSLRLSPRHSVVCPTAAARHPLPCRSNLPPLGSPPASAPVPRPGGFPLFGGAERSFRHSRHGRQALDDPLY